MSEELVLFDVPADWYVPPPVKLSADRRRTIRQRRILTVGLHPLSLATRQSIRLHPDAAPAGDRAASGLRCGSCRFREVVPYRSRAYAKCLYGWRVSHGAGTDCRAWWPACRDYQAEPCGSD
jgi:hypothetical protein